jgi:sporulation protein YlmC with PRC-barrel domain
MTTKLIVGALLASVMVLPAVAQSTKSSETDRPVTKAETVAPAMHGDVWRASKLKGLNVYNEQNEKLGDINELLVDKSGKVEGVVIGVGGFLGMGEHDIKVDMSKLKFVNEPVRTSSTTTTKTNDTTGAGPASAAPGQRATTSTTTTTGQSSDRKWYPDHAILSGASKEQLKSMPQFKYN